MLNKDNCVVGKKTWLHNCLCWDDSHSKWTIYRCKEVGHCLWWDAQWDTLVLLSVKAEKGQSVGNQRGLTHRALRDNTSWPLTWRLQTCRTLNSNSPTFFKNMHFDFDFPEKMVLIHLDHSILKILIILWTERKTCLDFIMCQWSAAQSLTRIHSLRLLCEGMRHTSGNTSGNTPNPHLRSWNIIHTFTETRQQYGWMVQKEEISNYSLKWNQTFNLLQSVRSSRWFSFPPDGFYSFTSTIGDNGSIQSAFVVQWRQLSGSYWGKLGNFIPRVTTRRISGDKATSGLRIDSCCQVF